MADVKKKLTLSVKASTIRRGKEQAARRGTSLSQLVEDFLERETSSDKPSFVDRWYGKFAWRERPGDPRLEYLKKKYGG